jgi:hypothetical protein
LERTSSVAFCRSSPISNSIEVVETPWTTDERMLDVRDAGDGVLDLTGDLGLHLAGGGAALGDGDGHQRERDVGILLDRQHHIAGDAGQDQGDEQNRDRDRVLDRPGGYADLSH